MFSRCFGFIRANIQEYGASHKDIVRGNKLAASITEDIREQYLTTRRKAE